MAEQGSFFKIKAVQNRPHLEYMGVLLPKAYSPMPEAALGEAERLTWPPNHTSPGRSGVVLSGP